MSTLRNPAFQLRTGIKVLFRIIFMWPTNVAVHASHKAVSKKINSLIAIF